MTGVKNVIVCHDVCVKIQLNFFLFFSFLSDQFLEPLSLKARSAIGTLISSFVVSVMGSCGNASVVCMFYFDVCDGWLW